ncbi:hypothetical protein [Klebsiella variicola]|uniref:hypothetical protein n=1 Tax=Klebsiella variicola TaxID=244366 RepID=UPI001D128F2A|nr:hypothetical protein [Klebsiella variicola]
MREPITLDQAEYKSGLACSLWEAILDKACKECSPVLVDLLSLACDINQEVHQSLAFSQGGGVMDNLTMTILTHAENALIASEGAKEVLSMWIDSIPESEERHSEAIRAGAVMALVLGAVSELVKAREAFDAQSSN